MNENHTTTRYKDTTTEIIDDTPPLWFSKRLLVATVLFFSFINFQILRNNINIIVVEMTANKSYIEENSTIWKSADYNWDTTTIGLIISILAYGGLFAIFGDLVINRIGASVTCAWCMLISGILTILHPAVLYLNFNLFLVCRFLTGVLEVINTNNRYFGVGDISIEEFTGIWTNNKEDLKNFASSVITTIVKGSQCGSLSKECSCFWLPKNTSDIFSRWFPKNERSTLISFSFNGTNIGVAIVYPICGYLAYKWGWRVAFYVTGFVSVISSIFCFIFVKNLPSQDKWISKKELSYILKETDRGTKIKVNHPYKSIFASVPVWALCISTFVFMWVASVFSYLPIYIRDSSQKTIDEIGFISSIPNIVSIFMFPINGAIMDYWKNHSNVTTTEIHKIVTGIAYFFASLMFVVLALTSNLIASLTVFVLIQIPMSFMPLIGQVIAVNLAPEHSSVVASIQSSVFSLSCIAAQTITGFMITNHSKQEWNNCFYLAAVISTLGAVIFALYGSSEAQSWASTSSTKEERSSVIRDGL